MPNELTETGKTTTTALWRTFEKVRIVRKSSTVGLETPLKAIAPEGTTVAEIDEAGETLKSFLRPAELDRLRAWLAQLWLTTSKYSDSVKDRNDRIEIYARRLRAYPASIVQRVVLGYRKNKWPEWGLLVGMIESDDEMVDYHEIRQALLDLRAELLAAERGEPPAERPTDAQIEQMDTRAAEMRAIEEGRHEQFWTPERREAFRERFDPAPAEG